MKCSFSLSYSFFPFVFLLTVVLKVNGNPKAILCLICFIEKKSRFHTPNIAFMSLGIA